jgi:hypothetical protein
MDINQKSNSVVQGSVVTSSNGIFFIAISLGRVSIYQKSFCVISSESPIGRQLLGKKIGDEVRWNSQVFRILEID